MKRLFYLFLCFFMLAGCGYTTRGFIYSEDSIIIEPILNKIDLTSDISGDSSYRTFPVLLEKKLTNLVINKFNVEGNLQVVSAGSDALNLKCEIVDYTKEGLRYTNSDDIEEQRLRLIVEIKLRDSLDKVLKERSIVGETTYYLSGSQTKSEASAQEDLIEDTARRIVEAVVEAW